MKRKCLFQLLTVESLLLMERDKFTDTGTYGSRVVIPTVRSASSGSEECNPNSQK